jgi:hypothetical protein
MGNQQGSCAFTDISATYIIALGNHEAIKGRTSTKMLQEFPHLKKRY